MNTMKRLGAWVSLFVGLGLCPHMAGASDCVPVPAGLVSWWRGEGNADDAVGSNHGQLRNGAAFAPGKVGQGFLFDGVDDFVLVPDSPSLDLTNEITLEMWFKSETWAHPITYSLIDKRTLNNCNYGAVVSEQWGFQLYYDDPTVGGSFEISATFPLPTTNVFHHFAGTYRQVDAGHVELKTYLDAVLVRTDALPGNLAKAVNNIGVAIGNARGGAGTSFKGVIDEVSLYNRALSAEEVAAIHNAGDAGKCDSVHAPTIVTQPQSQTVVFGAQATFSVVTSGTVPLTYEWLFNGSAIPGATGSTLTISNVQAEHAGTYAVSVSNSAGSVSSADAVLTVISPPDCTPVPEGLVAWWRAEGTADDSVGSNHGQLQNGASFAPGKVGQGFRLDGIDDFILVPDSDSLDLTNEITMEMWFKSEQWGEGRTWALLDKRTWNDCNYGVVVSEPWGFQLYYNDPNVFGGDHPGNIFEISSYTPLPTLNEFHHFAGTYRQVDTNHIELKTYLDGLLVRSRVFEGDLANAVNDIALAIGSARGGADGGAFRGIIDEVSLYNRALSAEEVAAIYNAGAAGKCESPRPPAIVAQPQSQTVVLGGQATFSVGASGTPPLSYQWLFNGTELSGATASTLTLSGAQAEHAGSYSVQVSNSTGSVTSAEAVLTVTSPPDCVPLPAGLVAWWRGEGNADDAVGSNHGQLHNGASFAPGKVGQGFLFDGMDDFVLVPDSPSLDLTNEITVEMWFKSETWADPITYSLIDKRTWNDCNYGAVVSEQWGFQLYYDDPTVGPSFEISATFPLPATDVFHHFAGTYRQVDPSQIELRTYLDGVLVRTEMLPGNLANAVNDMAVTIGNARGGAGPSFHGVIDEVSLYNRALSAEEVAAIHNAGSGGKCPVNGENSSIGARIALSPQIDIQTAPHPLVIASDGSTANVVLEGTGLSAPDNAAWFVTGSETPFSTEILAHNTAPLGVHSITLVASDAQSSRTATLVFEVITPSEAVAQLSLLIETFDLQRKNKQPLLASLRAAIISLENGRREAAIGQLRAFKQKVRAQLGSSYPALTSNLAASAETLIGILTGSDD